MTRSSLHERIRADVERKIITGRWLAGRRIPFEHELMRQYGCARMTVSKALSALAQAGLIDRRRRAGTFVSRLPVHSAVLTIPDIQSAIEQRGDTYSYELLSRSVWRRGSTDAMVNQLAGAPDAIVLHCRHLASGTPFALEHRAISLQAVPDAASVDFAVLAPGAWLVANVLWTRAEHRISALAANARTARWLDLRRGAPCLALQRQTWRNSTDITAVQQIFPAPLFDLVARFTPGTRASQPASTRDGRSLTERARQRRTG